MHANRLTGFLFEDHVAHGAFVELGDGLETMLGHRAYSPEVGRLVTEVMGALPLLATHLPSEARISLQFQGQGAMRLLLGQIDHQLRLRAMAKAPAQLHGGFETLLAGGILALMIEPLDGHRPASQAHVPIRGRSLAEALEGYFAQSEQLPTLIRLAAAEGRVNGFLLQRLPLQHAAGDEDSWNRLWHLASTLSAQELLQAPPQTLLKRLFPEDDLRIFEPRAVQVGCRCSDGAVARLLLMLGREEVASIVAEQGRVGVSCEFCGQAYAYSAAQVEELFAAAESEPGATRH